MSATAAAANVGPRFGLVYDMRNPNHAERSFEDFYAQVLEQLRWAEQNGVDAVWMPEHHFVDDGYLPSPMVLLAAVAAQTQLHIGTSVLVPAFHNPIRLAEDAAVLSIISNGRFDLGLALGYLRDDFEAFGQRIEQRVSLLEETVEVVRRAMGGRSLQFDSKRFHLPDAKLAPVPRRPPRILLGAHKKVAIERAARIADGFIMGTSLNSDSDDYQTYLDALVECGKDPAEAQVSAVQWSMVAEDPEAAWAELGDFALYKVNLYASWGAFPGMTGFEHRDELLEGGYFSVIDGPTATKQLTELLSERPCIRDVQAQAFLPGEGVESSTARLEYYIREVIEPVRANLKEIRAARRSDDAGVAQGG